VPTAAISTKSEQHMRRKEFNGHISTAGWILGTFIHFQLARSSGNCSGILI